jgi:hypothetical protein
VEIIYMLALPLAGEDESSASLRRDTKSRSYACFSQFRQIMHWPLEVLHVYQVPFSHYVLLLRQDRGSNLSMISTSPWANFGRL